MTTNLNSITDILDLIPVNGFSSSESAVEFSKDTTWLNWSNYSQYVNTVTKRHTDLTQLTENQLTVYLRRLTFHHWVNCAQGFIIWEQRLCINICLYIHQSVLLYNILKYPFMILMSILNYISWKHTFSISLRYSLFSIHFFYEGNIYIKQFIKCHNTIVMIYDCNVSPSYS